MILGRSFTALLLSFKKHNETENKTISRFLENPCTTIEVNTRVSQLEMLSSFSSLILGKKSAPECSACLQ